MTTNVGGKLQQIVERVESLEAEKRTSANLISETYAEAKSQGFDTKVLRKLIARRKRDRNTLAEEEAILEMYESALMAAVREMIA